MSGYVYGPFPPLEFQCTVCGVRHGTPACSPRPKPEGDRRG